LYIGFTSAATTANLWLYPNAVFESVQLRDTASDPVIVYPNVDTGDTFAGEYINCDYQRVTSGSQFKIVWNYGAAFTDILAGSIENFTFNFDSLTFYYKGILPNQTMTVFLGSSWGCGDALILDSLGTVAPSTHWTRVALPIATAFARRDGIRELRFKIRNNAGTTDTAHVFGNLKMDNIVLIGAPLGIKTPYRSFSNYHDASTMIPSKSGKIELSGYSVSGALLFSRKVDVVAGVRYNVRDVLSKHIGDYSTQVCLIKILGSGIDITRKIW
jgi:hypothetical protein